MSVLSETVEVPLRASRGDALLASVVGLWGGSAAYLAWSQWYSADNGGPEWLYPLMIVLPVLVFIAALSSSSRVRHWVLGLDLRILIGIHATRTIGLGFIFLYSFDLLPGLFAFPAGLGDAATALGAAWLAFMLGRGLPVSRGAIVRWNLFGAADFVIAVGIGLVLRSTALGGHITTDPMAVLPLALIPLFAVPLLFITHLIIGYQLRERWRDVQTLRLPGARP